MKNKTQKLAITALLTAVAVVGSMFSFPVFGSRCAPVQHMVNVLLAVFVGPLYSLTSAFLASLIRNISALGSLLAFPGSMIGALLSALAYKHLKNIPLTLVAELVGTGIIGGLAAYPIAIAFMGKGAGDMAFYVYVLPFLISTTGGVIIAALLLGALDKAGLISKIQKR